MMFIYKKTELFIFIRLIGRYKGLLDIISLCKLKPHSVVGIGVLARCFNPSYATLEIYRLEISTLISYTIWFSTKSVNEPSIGASLQLKLFVPSQQPKVYTLLWKYT
jgi:hypothetical protein